MTNIITKDMCLNDLINLPELSEIKDMWIKNYPEYDRDRSFASYDEVERFDSAGMVQGAQRLLDLHNQGRKLCYDIYTEEEKGKDPSKEKTGLVFFPGREGAPYVVICSGGGYVLQTNFSEGFPTASQFNKHGINAFVVTYRVKEPDDHTLLPKPFDDVAASVRFIEDHADELGVMKGHYALGGFSAGGHITGAWGSKNYGYRYYGLPAPRTLIFCYAASSWRLLAENTPKEMLTPGSFFAEANNAVLPENPSESDIDAVSYETQVDADYPPSFLWQTKTDPEVPFETSVRMCNALKAVGVTYELMEVEHGDHGMGLALNSEAEGWVERSIEFWKKNDDLLDSFTQ